MIDVATVVLAVAAVVAAVAVYLGESRRTDFEVARSLHHDLTSGEVGAARRSTGTITHGTEQQSAAIDAQAALTDYFSILWCFERIYHGRRSLTEGKLFPRRRSRAVLYLDRTLEPHLREWRSGVPKVHDELEQRLGTTIQDKDARQGLDGLIRDVL